MTHSPRRAARRLQPPDTMEITTLLERCIALERGAGNVYRTLAARAPDSDLARLWSDMARDEDEHARKLTTWRTLALAEAPERRTCADGFGQGVNEVANLIAGAREAAAHATTADDAFAVALALESSELDDIYAKLLQASPIARFPDYAETYQRESAEHHRALIDAIAARSTYPPNTLGAQLLAAAERHR